MDTIHCSKWTADLWSTKIGNTYTHTHTHTHTHTQKKKKKRSRHRAKKNKSCVSIYILHYIIIKIINKLYSYLGDRNTIYFLYLASHPLRVPFVGALCVWVI